MSDVVIRPIASREELLDAWEIIGAQFDPPLMRQDSRLADLARRLAADRSLMQVVEVNGRIVGGALAFRTSPEGVTIRVLGLIPSVRRQGLGRRLVEEVEDAARRLGVRGISLGADDAIGFYAHVGYTAVLMLQWVHDPTAVDSDITRLGQGCLAGLAFTREDFEGVPQVFVALPSADEALARRAEHEAPGCVAGFTMVKQL